MDVICHRRARADCDLDSDFERIGRKISLLGVGKKSQGDLWGSLYMTFALDGDGVPKSDPKSP